MKTTAALLSCVAYIRKVDVKAFPTLEERSNIYLTAAENISIELENKQINGRKKSFSKLSNCKK